MISARLTLVVAFLVHAGAAAQPGSVELDELPPPLTVDELPEAFTFQGLAKIGRRLEQAIVEVETLHENENPSYWPRTRKVPGMAVLVDVRGKAVWLTTSRYLHRAAEVKLLPFGEEPCPATVEKFDMELGLAVLEPGVPGCRLPARPLSLSPHHGARLNVNPMVLIPQKLPDGHQGASQVLWLGQVGGDDRFFDHVAVAAFNGVPLVDDQVGLVGLLDRMITAAPPSSYMVPLRFIDLYLKRHFPVPPARKAPEQQAPEQEAPEKKVPEKTR